MYYAVNEVFAARMGSSVYLQSILGKSCYVQVLEGFKSVANIKIMPKKRLNQSSMELVVYINPCDVTKQNAW